MKSEKEKAITQELLSSLFEYRDGNLYWKISKCDNGKTKVGEKAGWVSKTNSGLRAFVRVNGYTFYTARLIFFMHNNWWPIIVDHEDRNPLNNNIDNLRAATPVQNAENVSKKPNCSSRFIGVSKKGKNWAAQITIDKKRKYIGTYSTEIEAALAFNTQAKEHYGNFANLNILI